MGSTAANYLNSMLSYSVTVGGYSYGGQTSRFALLDGVQNGAPNGALSDLLNIRQDRDSPYTAGRNDFAYNSGPIGGYPLQLASIYSDTSPAWFTGVDLTAAPFLALQASPALLSKLSFNMYFLPASTGQVNALVLGAFRMSP